MPKYTCMYASPQHKIIEYILSDKMHSNDFLYQILEPKIFYEKYVIKTKKKLASSFSNCRNKYVKL